MKTILTLITLITMHWTQAQMIHQSYSKENGYTYWFSLDQYREPLNYVIEVSQLGGNITKLKGSYKGHKGSGDITISDLNGNILLGEKLGKELSFEFSTDQTDVIIEVLVNGYTVYQKQTKIDKLTVLVLKLQPEPQDEVYQINSSVELNETQLNEIMKCTDSHQSEPHFCDQKGVYEVILQI
ncbi:hypothetical protein [Fluviicola sp.]|uniref:hypothetical protein n=1 Tax=Fluviicola sp. TaxID=1917219 RepID=UPI0031D2AAD4